MISRAGGDPIDAFDSYTVIAFLFMFALAFAMRLIFLPQASAGLKRTVRILLSASFALSIPLALLGLVMSLSLPQSTKHGFVAIAFSVFALVCQTGSVFWLLRYSAVEL